MGCPSVFHLWLFNPIIAGRLSDSSTGDTSFPSLASVQREVRATARGLQQTFPSGVGVLNMDWMKVIEHLGFPAAALAALAWATWRAGVFLGRDIALPIAQRHVVFLDKVEECLTSSTESTKVLQEAVTALREGQERHESTHASLCRFRPCEDEAEVS
jgi:hypothetical protein